MNISRQQRKDISILALLSLGAAFAVASEQHPFLQADAPMDQTQTMAVAERQIIEAGPSADIQIASISSKRGAGLERSGPSH